MELNNRDLSKRVNLAGAVAEVPNLFLLLALFPIYDFRHIVDFVSAVFRKDREVSVAINLSAESHAHHLPFQSIVLIDDKRCPGVECHKVERRITFLPVTFDINELVGDTAYLLHAFRFLICRI